MKIKSSLSKVLDGAVTALVAHAIAIWLIITAKSIAYYVGHIIMVLTFEIWGK